MMWETDTLKNVCTMIKRGIAPKYVETGGVCVINQKCVRDHVVSTEQSRRHNLDTKKVPHERFIRLGDVLVNSTGTGTLGRVAQIREEPEEPTTVDTHVTIVRPIEGKFFDPFFGYMMVKIEDEIANSGEGASGQTELARTTLENKFQVSYPTSIEEQKRIVAILDEAFAGIDEAIAGTEKNIQNARDLFESHLNTIFTQKGEGWEDKKLIDVCVLQRGFDLPKRLRKEGGVPLVSSSGVIDTHIEAKVSKPCVATGRSGSIGNVFYIDEDFWPLNTVLYIKEFHGNDPEFIYHLLKKFDLKRFSSGAGVPTLNRNHVHDEIVCIPSDINEQRDIVKKLKLLREQTESLNATYQQKLTALKDLKQSLLQQAFAGELTSDLSEAA